MSKRIDLKAMDQLSVRMATVPYAHIHDRVLDQLITSLREARAALQAMVKSSDELPVGIIALTILDERFDFGDNK